MLEKAQRSLALARERRENGLLASEATSAAPKES